MREVELISDNFKSGRDWEKWVVYERTGFATGGGISAPALHNASEQCV